MENPFELILQRLDRIESLIAQNKNSSDIIEPKTKELEPTIFYMETLCEYLNMSKSSIYKLTASRGIPHYKRGKTLYFKKTEIDDWIMEFPITTSRELEREAEEYILKNKLSIR